MQQKTIAARNASWFEKEKQRRGRDEREELRAKERTGGS